MKKTFLAFLILIFSGFSSNVYSYETLQKATVKVAADVGPAVVSINSVVKTKGSRTFSFNGSPFSDNFDDDIFSQFFGEFFGDLPEREYSRRGIGSGVIIDKEGYILTNEHVVSDASEVKVKLPDGREYDAEIKGTDAVSDLAVIKINADDLPVAVLGDSDNLSIGEWVVAIGNPFGFAIENSEPTVTVGVVSGLKRFVPALGKRERSYDDLIQTDAAINPGNSGGPLVNLTGEVIGINTAIISTSGGFQGLGFAIPSNKAGRIIDKLIKGEKILYGWLGVSIQDLNDDLRSYFGIKEREGVIVVKIYKDSPAEDAGIKEGDLILSFNGKKIVTTKDLIRLVSVADIGDSSQLLIQREGKEKTLKIKIGKRPEDESVKENESSTDFRGMEVEPINEILKQRFGIKEQKGLIITYIEPGSPADKAGLIVGDVILKIEGESVESKDDFDKVVKKVKSNCLVKTIRGYFVVKE
ncbi:MAG: Do family serine endopeptidase [Candidatus Omnitrophica bacterium]|nr:Do family serine endopeptidase [Candidatus Omnitrophota bacterium]MDD5441243.1 Do family serine endopeptidase [Candidatus Omnitrophota bacterium]